MREIFLPFDGKNVPPYEVEYEEFLNLESLMTTASRLLLLKFVQASTAVVAVVALAGLMTFVDVRSYRTRKQHEQAREREHWQNMESGRKIAWEMLGSYERFLTASEDIFFTKSVPVTNLEDWLRSNLITQEKYQFLINHGAVFHAFPSAAPSNAVFLELFGGEYLMVRNGSAGHKSQWARAFGYAPVYQP